MTFEHEVIHFIQAITSAYLQNQSIELVATGVPLLRNHADLLSIPEGKIPLFAKSAKRLSARTADGLSCRDLLESCAVVESFKLVDLQPSLDRFLNFRDSFFPGDITSPYRRGFDWLAAHVGRSFAYELLAPICFVAFSGDNPPENFSTIVEDHLPEDLSGLTALSIEGIFSTFGMNIKNHFLHQIDQYSDKNSPVLLPCAKAAVAMIGLERLFEVAARPSLINSTLSPAEMDFLLPPVVAFSSSSGQKLQGSVNGLARTDTTLGSLVMELCALLGAAERLTILRQENTLYQFCPHKLACPHYASGLCFRWFAPPSLELGHEKCGFVKKFSAVAGAAPSDIWKLHAPRS
jgi:hypothetical protein